MPTTTSTEEPAPLLTRMARAAFESKVLRALAESPCGLARGEFAVRFPGVPSSLDLVLRHLTDNNQVYQYDGGVYGITPKGSSRLSPPVCVQS